MATTITQGRKTGRQAHSPARRSAPDHRHRHLRRRHQDAGHALRGDSAQSARGGQDSFDRHQQGRGAEGRRRGGFHRQGHGEGRAGAVRRIAARAARPASQHSGDRSRLFRRSSGGRSGRDRPIHRARRRRADRSRLRTCCRRWPIPRRRSRPGAPPVHPQWPDNVAFTFHQEGGDVDKAFAEADVIVKQRITSQRLIPNCHGNARRGGGVARGGPRS